MTAEVAVLNRVAVALAADSAVTIEKGSSTKIFQTENKLFQLSEQKPIGIMIYNSTNFFDVPWEIIIKDFRSKHRKLSISKLFDLVPVFLNYLMGAYKPNPNQQLHYAMRLVANSYVAIFDAFSQDTASLFQNVKKKTPESLDSFFRGSFNNVLDNFIADQVEENYQEMTVEQAYIYLDSCEDTLVKVQQRYFGQFPLTNIELKKLKEIAARSIISVRDQSFMTGLVFAGFGDDEIFPSLECVEINGVVADFLKKAHLERVDIDRRDMTGAVIPFAQKEAADSLLYGRSFNYESQVAQHFEDVIEQVGLGIVDRLVKNGKKRSELYEDVRAVTQEAIERFRSVVSQDIRDAFFNDILDTIRYMPKAELANFAEALVNVTSIKRKVSVGPETVGGPIDVAIISRHEGFVWVKRKLYFPSDLNPRFMWRSRRQNDENESQQGRDSFGETQEYQRDQQDGS